MRKRLATAVQTIRNEIGVYRAVMKDPRCPRVARWLLGGAVAYALSPIDLIPDFIPVLGHLDDLLVLPLLVWLAVRLVPKELIAEHRTKRGLRTGSPTSECTAIGGGRRSVTLGVWSIHSRFARFQSLEIIHFPPLPRFQPLEFLKET